MCQLFLFSPDYKTRINAVFVYVFVVPSIMKRLQQQHTLPRGTFGPHFRMTSASGTLPSRPPTALPQGFHVFMEMAPGAASSATGDQTNSTEQPSLYHFFCW